MGGPVSRVKRPYNTPRTNLQIDPGVYTIRVGLGVADIYFINNGRPFMPVRVDAAVAIWDEKGSPVQGLVELNFRVWRLLTTADNDGRIANWQPISDVGVYPQKLDPTSTAVHDTSVDLRGMYWVRFAYAPGLPEDDPSSVGVAQFGQHVFAIDVCRFRIGHGKPWVYSGRTFASVVVHHGSPEPQWDDEGHFIPPEQAPGER